MVSVSCEASMEDQDEDYNPAVRTGQGCIEARWWGDKDTGWRSGFFS